MFVLISGASGSGKSEFAENLALALGEREHITYRIYTATMIPYGEEGTRRVERHRQMREGKGFFTVEEPFFPCDALENFVVLESIEKKNTLVLTECLSNLVANLMFEKSAGEGTLNEEAGKLAISQVLGMAELCKHIIVVTNEVFSDGNVYGEETRFYMETLGKANKILAQRADIFCEVVYSVPVFLKGEKLCPC